MRYEFATAVRIIVGPGSSAELPELAAQIGSRAMLVHGQRALERGGPVAALIQQFDRHGLAVGTFTVDGEPRLAMVEMGAEQARALVCDMIIGIGGGSVLDAAKAIAGLAANHGGVLDYLEVVGAGKPLEQPALPIIAVPTTAGTGSEVTRNAVIAAPEQHVKASMRHASLLPRLALVDSTLTHDLPPEVTASTGMDALTQLLEAYVSRRAQPLTDGLCVEGLARAARALPRAYHQPGDAVAREEMSTASLFSGLALANAGLGAVHGIAAPLGGAFPVPHGVACAALLPHVTAINIRALQRSDPDGPALARYARAADILLGRSGSPDALLSDLVAHVRSLVAELGIPPLRSFGVTTADVPELAAKAMHASSTRGNPVTLEQAEFEEAISAAL
ncbi:MAG TPA: iron-containing alcohol dehydrogenase [Roseiflexaceae bacterium]|nr:iron-containing alcohol dehydrogenase [Roseiflexaceae bacterium]